MKSGITKGGLVLFENTLCTLGGYFLKILISQDRDPPTHPPTAKSTPVLFDFLLIFAKDTPPPTQFLKLDEGFPSRFGIFPS